MAAVVTSSSHPRIDSLTPLGAATTPSAERNKIPLAAELSRIFSRDSRVLELASGTGQHAAHFCANLSIAHFQPTDETVLLFASILAHADLLLNSPSLRGRLAPPRILNVLSENAGDWIEPGTYDGVIVINLLHIAPIGASLGAFSVASRALKVGGKLAVYGPFTVSGSTTVESNVAFDADLRARDERWGLRDLDDVITIATTQSLTLTERINMPANNLLLIFDRLAIDSLP